ncbi:MAG: hypothetical protein ACK42L_03895 [Thermoanaerobaculum sp.]
MWLGVCVLCMQVLQAPPLAVVVRSEGGINPSEEKVTFFQDGRLLLESWSLAQRDKRQSSGRLDPQQFLTLESLLAKAQKANWPPTLNQARGAQVAFSVTLTWWWQGKETSTTGYTFGEPPLPEDFGKLTQELFALAAKAMNLSPPR